MNSATDLDPTASSFVIYFWKKQFSITHYIGSLPTIESALDVINDLIDSLNKSSLSHTKIVAKYAEVKKPLTLMGKKQKILLNSGVLNRITITTFVLSRVTKNKQAVVTSY